MFLVRFADPETTGTKITNNYPVKGAKIPPNSNIQIPQEFVGLLAPSKNHRSPSLRNVKKLRLRSRWHARNIGARVHTIVFTLPL